MGLKQHLSLIERREIFLSNFKQSRPGNHSRLRLRFRPFHTMDDKLALFFFLSFFSAVRF